MAHVRKQRKTQSRTAKKAQRPPTQVDWRPAFLASLAALGNVSRACEAARIARSAVYDLRKSDADFALAWDEALEEAADVLEAEARRRAVEGVDEPVFGSLGGRAGSGEIGTIRKYSDTLLIFLLKGARPSKFRDNYNIRHEGRIDGTVDIPQLDAMVSKIYGNGDSDSGAG